MTARHPDVGRPVWRFRRRQRSRVRQRFTHGPGASYLRAAAAKAPDRGAGIVPAKWDGAAANMSAALRAMKPRRGILSRHRASVQGTPQAGRTSASATTWWRRSTRSKHMTHVLGKARTADRTEAAARA